MSRTRFSVAKPARPKTGKSAPKTPATKKAYTPEEKKAYYNGLYAEVTDQIIAALEQGVRPWIQPWSACKATERPKRANGQPFSGANVLILWTAGLNRGYGSPYWLTAVQARELGGTPREGEHRVRVFMGKSKLIQGTDPDATEDGTPTPDTTRVITYRRPYFVFNAEQVDGLPEHFYQPPTPSTETMLQRDARWDAFVANTGAEIRYGGNRAFFRPSEDVIQMPTLAQFTDLEAYYATLLHELTHWTGHSTRLDRGLAKGRFGDMDYAKEELIAEIGAAFLCADLGITPNVREDHAHYIANWLRVLKGDKKWIFTAASLASKAVEHLHGYQGAQTHSLVA